MKRGQFNPFEDRLSRDIRNDLSESLLEVIKRRTILPAQVIADGYEERNLSSVYREYIQNRLKRYKTALEILPDNRSNCLVQAVILWDLGLFFEVHEILEPEWIQAKGDRKLLLQALIRAAGVYIFLELGYTERAAKISQKSIPVLRQFKNKLQTDLHVDLLISALEELSPESPLLGKK